MKRMFVLFKILALLEAARAARAAIGNSKQELGTLTSPVPNYRAMTYPL